MATNDRSTSSRPRPNQPPRRGGWLATALAFIVAAGCYAPEGEETDVQSAELRGSNVSGMNVSGMNVSGMNVSGMNVSGMNVSGMNVSGMNVSGMNVSGMNVSGMNVSGMNVSGMNVSGMNVSGMNVSGMNVSGMNVSGMNVSGMNVSGMNVSGMNVSGMNVSGMNAGWSGVEGSTGGHVRVGANLPRWTVATRLLHGGEDLRPESERCLLRGIGTTAFAQLLGQQTPTSTLRAAIGKLPWGWSASAGGPIQVSAWEVIAQGDRTRCTFVLATPPETDWIGVAGFIKAVFRWNASPAQTMKVSAIVASGRDGYSTGPEIATYSGMMDAGSRWRTGRITERNLVAGELAFIAATTNNRSILVDFASWVADDQGAGLVLGNVESVNPPTFAESVYYAYDNGDGTIGLALGPASLRPDGEVYNEHVASSYESLDVAYRLYKEGLFPRPIPNRCGGVLFLNARHGEPMAQGKCDSTLTWTVAPASGYRGWDTVAGTTAPMNGYMLLPADAGTPLRRNGKVVLSETYIHMWGVNYDYDTATSASRRGGDRAGLLGMDGESQLGRF